MQRAGAIASLIAALVAVAEFIVAFFAVGVDAALTMPADAAVARANAMPMVGLELLHVAGAGSILMVVLAIQRRMAEEGVPNVRVAALLGFTASLLMTSEGIVGVFAVAQTARAAGQAGAQVYTELLTIVTYFGLFALLAYGFWCLVTCSGALQTGLLPKGLGTLGYALGSVNVIAFLFPPAEFLSLGLAFLWSLWLGIFLWRE